MPRQLTAEIAQQFSGKDDLDSKVTSKTAWEDIGPIYPEEFSTPSAYVAHYNMKDATKMSVLRHIIGGMCNKCFELKNIVPAATIGINIPKGAKYEDWEFAYNTRLKAVMWNLYKKHCNDDNFLANFAQVHRKELSKPTSSGWHMIFNAYKAEVADKVAKLDTKKARKDEEDAQMDKLVKKTLKLKLQKE